METPDNTTPPPCRRRSSRGLSLSLSLSFTRSHTFCPCVSVVPFRRVPRSPHGQCADTLYARYTSPSRSRRRYITLRRSFPTTRPARRPRHHCVTLASLATAGTHSRGHQFGGLHLGKSVPQLDPPRARRRPRPSCFTSLAFTLSNNYEFIIYYTFVISFGAVGLTMRQPRRRLTRPPTVAGK